MLERQINPIYWLGCEFCRIYAVSILTLLQYTIMNNWVGKYCSVNCCQLHKYDTVNFGPLIICKACHRRVVPMKFYPHGLTLSEQYSKHNIRTEIKCPSWHWHTNTDACYSVTSLCVARFYNYMSFCMINSTSVSKVLPQRA